MSQVFTRSNISEIHSLSLTGRNSGWNIGAIVLPVVTSVATAGVRELITGSVEIQTTQLSVACAGSTILSPNELRSRFASYYQTEMDAFAMKQFTREVRQKAAVVNTLQRLDYMTENKEVISEKIQQLVTASSTQTRTKIESLMKEVEMQHTQMFTRELASVVAEASKEAGFGKVDIVYKDALPEIVALDARGRAIRSEVRVNNKSKVLDLVSETIGISDGTCNDVMEAFSKALERHGVKSSTGDRKWTGGQCWLPGSRDVEQKLKKLRHSKELQRTRKLNVQDKIKI